MYDCKKWSNGRPDPNREQTMNVMYAMVTGLY